MIRKNYTFTSESVSEGHPDKICDRISDEIVDMYLQGDCESAWDTRVAAETLATKDRVVVAGEFRRKKEIEEKEIEQKIRETIKEIGYEQDGFHWENVGIEILRSKQTKNIAQGVDAEKTEEEGAGDQGIMFGYACKDTKELMPAPIYYSHKILKALAEKRKKGELDQLLPDAKSQISVVYENGKPIGISKIVISHQHKKGNSADDVREMIAETVQECLPKEWIPKKNEWIINPTGEFTTGGPKGDAGLTGRKIIVDTYGGFAPHGGGAFSGKDCTKVDRSAAYAARYLAKNIVAAEIAEQCTIQLSYAIGRPEPLSVYVDAYLDAKHNSKLSEKLENIIKSGDIIDLRPAKIRKTLGLTKPIFAKTAAYGHFGREPSENGHFSWEKIDLVKKIKKKF